MGWRAGLVVALCLACSSEPSASDGVSGAGGVGGSGGASVAAVGGAEAGKGGTSTAGGAVPGGSGGASGGDGPILPADLLPLAVGNTWTYSPTTLTSGCGTPNQIDVVSLEPYEGRDAYQLVEGCFSDAPSWLSVANGEIQQFVIDTWRTSLGAPVAEGARWVFNDTLQMEWSSAGTVTVPAGTFQNCWTRFTVERSTEIHRTYCPGVGRVRDQTADARTELTTYDLKR